MKNYLLSFLAVIMLTVLSMDVKAQIQINSGSNAGFWESLGSTGTPIDFTSDQPFDCSSVELTLKNTSGTVYVFEDACGNIYTLTGANNLPAGINPGCTFTINSSTALNPNQPLGAATFNIQVACN